MRKFLLLTGLAVLLLALPAVADSVIYSGIDLWKTMEILRDSAEGAASSRPSRSSSSSVSPPLMAAAMSPW